MAGTLKPNEFPQGDTVAAKELDPRKEIAHVNSSFMVSDGVSREKRPNGYDFTYVSDSEMRRYGGNPDTEVPCYIRNPELWGKLQGGEGQDRAREFLSDGEGRRIPTPNGEFVKNQDLILAFKPRAEVEAQERETEADALSFRRMLDGEEDIRGERTIPRYRSGQKTLADSEAEHRRNTMAGIIGETKGRDWMEVVERNPEKYARDRARYLGGNITVADVEAMDKANRSGGGGKRGSQFAVGADFAPKVTPNSALAQARNAKR